MALLWFYLLFYGALLLGYGLKRNQKFAPTIMRYTILILETPIFIYSFWILDMNQVRNYAPIPIISLLLVLIALWLSPYWAKRLFPDKPAQGSFILTAAFSNIGTTGGAFICYLLFGLPGLALGYLFLLPYPFLIFTLGFSIAKHHGCDCHLTMKDYVLNIFSNLISIIPLLAIACGLTLNFMDYTPPTLLEPIMDGIIKIDLAIMCLAIGMTIEIHKVFKAWKAIQAMTIIKFLILPILSIGMILLAYGSLAPLASKVILIQAAMPPAIYAVITANLYKLDRDLVNALWFATTLFLIPIVAVLFIVVRS